MFAQRRVVVFLGFLAGFYLLGCQEAPTVPQDGQGLGVQLDADEADDEGEVSGENVTLYWPEYLVGYTQVYDFEAEKDDGEVEGRFRAVWTWKEIQPPATELVVWAKGVVTCFTIDEDGKTARLAGLVTKGNLLDILFELFGDDWEDYKYALWTVRDNGDGDDDEDGDGDDDEDEALDEAIDIVGGFTQADAELHCRSGEPYMQEFWEYERQEQTVGEIEVETDD